MNARKPVSPGCLLQVAKKLFPASIVPDRNGDLKRVTYQQRVELFPGMIAIVRTLPDEQGCFKAYADGYTVFLYKSWIPDEIKHVE